MPKLTAGQKTKRIGVESEATSNPNSEPVNRNVRAFDCSDEVTAILEVSYNFVKNCPPTEIVNKKIQKEYKALVNRVDAMYKKVTRDSNIPEDSRVIARIDLAKTYYYLSNLYTFNAMVKLNSALIFALRSLQLLNGYELQPEILMTAMRCFYFVCCLCQDRNMPAEAWKAAKKATSLYTSYRKLHGLHTVTVDLSCLDKEEEKMTVQVRLISHYTCLMNRMIDICRTETFKESYKFKILEYQHRLLKELLYLTVNTRPIKTFVIVAYDLVKSLLRLNRFTEAKDHIIAATFMLINIFHENKYKCTILSNREYIEIFVIINVMWGVYGTHLLQSSNKRLLQKYEKNSVVENAESTSALQSEEIKLPTLLFTKMRNKFKSYTSLITDTLVFDHDNVNEVFVFIMQSLHRNFEIKNTDMKNMEFDMWSLLYISNAYEEFACHQSRREDKIDFIVYQRSYLQYILKLKNKILTSCQNDNEKYILLITHLKKAIVLSHEFEYGYENYEPFQSDCNGYCDMNIEIFMTNTANGMLVDFEIYLRDIEIILNWT